MARVTKDSRAYQAWQKFPLNVTPVIKGEDVVKARRRLQVSQEQFAQHMGVSSRTVKAWERDPNCWVRDPCQAREISAILNWQ